MMRVYFIGAGPGAPDLITVRGRAILRTCRVCVYAGSLVSAEHLSALPEKAEVHNSAKMSLEQICAVFLDAKGKNLDVARLHTGDPSLFGAIGEQIAFCDDNAIDCEVVPGVSSFSASAAALKKELTLPGISQTVILTRCEGRTPVPEKEKLEKLAASRSSMCIFLSAGLINSVVGSLLLHYPPNTPVTVVSRVTWHDQKIISADLSSIAARLKEECVSKTAMILVGDILRERGELSKLYDRSFSTEYRSAK
jgi:precorrin-4/cobalt-precorrin-4 C11-methyltransferase